MSNQSYDPNEDIIERMLHRPQKFFINYAIILANIAMFIITSVTGSAGDSNHLLALGASYAPAIRAGEYWRLFTSMFLHVSLIHLFRNMILLLFIGDYV